MFHDYWYVGWGNQQATDWSNARKIQLARLKPGQPPQQTAWNATDIEAFADEVVEHVAMIRYLGGVMRVPEWAAEYPPRANLVVDDDGKVHPRKGPP